MNQTATRNRLMDPSARAVWSVFLLGLYCLAWPVMAVGADHGPGDWQWRAGTQISMPALDASVGYAGNIGVIQAPVDMSEADLLDALESGLSLKSEGRKGRFQWNARISHAELNEDFAVPFSGITSPWLVVPASVLLADVDLVLENVETSVGLFPFRAYPDLGFKAGAYHIRLDVGLEAQLGSARLPVILKDNWTMSFLGVQQAFELTDTVDVRIYADQGLGSDYFSRYAVEMNCYPKERLSFGLGYDRVDYHLTGQDQGAAVRFAGSLEGAYVAIWYRFGKRPLL